MASGRCSQTLSSSSGISADQWMQARQSLDDVQKKDGKQFSFLDEDSSDSSFSDSHFIKKDYSKTKVDSKKPATFHTEKASFKPVHDIRPKTSHGTSEPEVSKTVQKSSALNRFAELEKQILSRHKIEKVSLSVSDLDISSDFEIKKDAEQMRKERKAAQEAAPSQFSFLDSSSSDGDDIKFVRPASKTEPKSTSDVKPRSINSESLEKASYPKKTVSFASNLIQDSPSPHEVSLDDFLPSHPSGNESSSLDDVLPSSNLQNVKSLDDLLASDDEKQKSDSDLFNLHSVEELEITSPPELAEDSGSSGSDGNLFNLHSVEELDVQANLSKEVLLKKSIPEPVKSMQSPGALTSPFHAPDQARTTGFKSFQAAEVRASLEDVPELDEYTAEFDSSSVVTAERTESVAQVVKTASLSESSSSSSTIRTATHSSSEETADDVSYTETFETDESTAQPEVTVPDRKSISRVEIAVQTEPTAAETFRSKFEDIAPSDRAIFQPSQLLSNEVLSAMTTYSPAILAVQDMIKQQLQFTRDFISRSERMHKAAQESLVADYQYASLEEARELIKQSRSRFTT